jgi:hypothetical protein
MKKLILSLSVALMALAGSAQANEQVNALVTQIALAQVSPITNVINWQLGDYADMNMTMSGMPLGTIHKEAMSEEGNAVWLKQAMSGGMIGNQVVEVLIDRATGKTLKMKQNGEEKPVPDDKIEIIDQETATITVPAGTFETIHIRAKSQQGPLELWANPQAIKLDGAAKMTMETQGMSIAMELTKFGGK